MNKKKVRIIKQKIQKHLTDDDTEVDMNCSCQILNDTSLSNVNDSDCSCSQCLQANLNAFNEFKVEQKTQQRKLIQSANKESIATNLHHKNNQSSYNINKNSNLLNRNSSLNINKKTMPILRNQINQYSNQNKQEIQNYDQYSFQQFDRNKLTQQNLNDYILITRQRTRKYIQERKKLENQNKKEKDQFKNKIKENLQILKYTAKVKRQISIVPQNDQKIQNNQPPNYKWNHQAFVTKRMKILDQNKKNPEAIKKIQHIHQELDTNLNKFNPEFSKKRDQILQKIKQTRIENLKPKEGCPYDHCPNHHMRTSPTKIQKIQQFIKKQVQKYTKKQQKIKKKQADEQKVKKAKLRAIEIKSKQILAKSKKYDDRISQRSSFHMSIDNFSTFSELRQTQKERQQIRNKQKGIKKMMKQKNNKIQEAIYQDLQNQFDQQQELNAKIRINKHQQNQIGNMKDLKDKKKQIFNEKIMKQARIISPRILKQEDKIHKKTLIKKTKVNQLKVKEEQKRKIQVQLQIQKKKKELMKQYKKQQELKQSKNQKIKQKYNNYLSGTDFASERIN